ncbi:hypothetical protein B0H65DRAFT_444618 [Neurospora tetraspora]|uniref:Uncharacterized protein n=1 Tax=Neurospora tetraspora TaxID=94610 RepID=A0AAE0JAZ5_9PEZI|nr:hypothetical protein B0H65DRAFT_444618 [Neurospora tetraspora]
MCINLPHYSKTTRKKSEQSDTYQKGNKVSDAVPNDMQTGAAAHMPAPGTEYRISAYSGATVRNLIQRHGLGGLWRYLCISKCFFFYRQLGATVGLAMNSLVFRRVLAADLAQRVGEVPDLELGVEEIVERVLESFDYLKQPPDEVVTMVEEGYNSECGEALWNWMSLGICVIDEREEENMRLVVEESGGDMRRCPSWSVSVFDHGVSRARLQTGHEWRQRRKANAAVHVRGNRTQSNIS